MRVRDGLPAGIALADLGVHRLKYLGRPERIFQLHAAGLPAGFPPLRSLGNPALPNNLPAQLSTFIGRDREVAEVRALVESSRLVTLTGAGGCAKTADTILRRCPRVHLLATSREPLGIGGETIYRVPSLSLPEPNDSGCTAPGSSDAVALFADRARANGVALSAEEQDGPVAVSVCRRLDGMPLAIELAAARLRPSGCSCRCSGGQTPTPTPRCSPRRWSPARSSLTSLTWPRPGRLLNRRSRSHASWTTSSC